MLPATRAFRPLMLTILPQPEAFRRGIAARAQRRAPMYLTLKSSRKSSSTIVSIRPVAVGEPPGREPLLMSICSPPSSRAAAPTAASTRSRSVTSQGMGNTRRPVAVEISLAVRASSSAVRALIAISTPSRASSSAIALPIPRLPPTTRPRFPANPKSIARSS